MIVGCLEIQGKKTGWQKNVGHTIHWVIVVIFCS
nr:unnamed protein product [Callosobruchus chinensis]